MCNLSAIQNANCIIIEKKTKTSMRVELYTFFRHAYTFAVNSSKGA